MHREAIPEHIYYHPINPSERHPLHVEYDIFPHEYDFETAPNPLHPLDPAKHMQRHHEIGKIEPIKKYVDYYGTHYLNWFCIKSKFNYTTLNSTILL